MKRSKKCPKCGSEEIVRVEGLLTPNCQGNSLLLGRTIFSAVMVPRYACCNCGYCEEWVEQGDLHKLREYRKKQNHS